MNEIVDSVIFQQLSSRFLGLAELFFAVGSGKSDDKNSESFRIPDTRNPSNPRAFRILTSRKQGGALTLKNFFSVQIEFEETVKKRKCSYYFQLYGKNSHVTKKSDNFDKKLL